MDDLVAWLTEIWDEQEKRERAKRAWGDRPPPVVAYLDGRVKINWRSGMTQELTQAAFERTYVTPAADREVLARIAADRQILDAYQKTLSERAPNDPYQEGMVRGWVDGLDLAVRLLAQPYADRPGFRDEWRVIA